MKDDKLYLVHIRECIERIEAYTTDGRDAFLADVKTQDAVLRNLQVLSESTQRLSVGIRDAYPKVDWQGIHGFRNVLVHEYLGISLERVWEIVSRDLPDLKREVLRMIEEAQR